MTCPNCNGMLHAEANFCAVCGQPRTDLRDHSVWRLMVDSVGDFFHFDSKFFRTIGHLLFRPGFLTVEYLQGRRARYFQPFKMFLFVSVIYFITAGLMRSEPPVTQTVITGSSGNVTDRGTGNLNLTLKNSNQRLFTMPVDSLELLVKTYGFNRLVDLEYPRVGWMTRFLIKQTVRNRIKGFDSLQETLAHTISRLIFILIPVFALLLKLLYIRRRIPYYDHAIFTLHMISLVFILLWLGLFASLLVKWSTLAIISIISIYLFFGIKRVYRQSRIKMAMKWFLLVIGTVFVIAGFFLLAGTLSFLLM
jgi:hypothetical protein